VRADAVHIEGLAASLRAEAARLERSAAAVRSARPDRAARLSASAAQKLREAGRLEADVAALRRQAAELERGAASATADFPTAEEADALFERARSGDLVRVPLAQAERQPGLLARLVRPLLRSRSGNRVVFRVEGGGSRRLISIGPGNNLTVARGAGIDLNFGSYERAVEFLTRHRGPGARIVAFEVDEAWVRSLRSVAIPEKGTGALAGQTRLVDVRFADDQLQLPARLIDELERFIIPGSGRVLEIGH